MPGTPSPVGVGPGGTPPFWNAVLTAIQGTQQAVNGLASGAPAGWVTDQNGNVTELSGANLNQIVTIGAAFQQAGVQVATGFVASPPVSGRAQQTNLCTTTITLTKGSTSASAGAVTGPGLAAGMVIGAASVNDPTSGTPTSALTPGTTISVAGTSGPPYSLTLSQAAAESGTSLYCAACNFALLGAQSWQNLTLGTNVSIFGSVTATGRFEGDRVRLRGVIQSSTAMSAGTVWLTVPAALAPSRLVGGVVGFNSGSQGPVSFQIGSSGNLTLLSTIASASQPMFLDGITYTQV